MSNLPHLIHQCSGQAQGDDQNRYGNRQPTKLLVPAQVPHLDPQDLKSDESEPENKDRGMKMQDEWRRRHLALITREVHAKSREYRRPDHADPDYVDLPVAGR